jgi:(p)ppGpp synthase/HD superfamily hydrolase
MTIQEKIERAEKLARIVHHNQVDKRGVPYMDHVTDIAYRVQELGHVFQIVAILHDTIEDTKPKKSRKRLRKTIRDEFGDIIYDAVVAISKRPDEDYFKDYLVRVADNPIALQVKLADIRANLSNAWIFEDEYTEDGGWLSVRLRDKYKLALTTLGQVIVANTSNKEEVCSV